MQGQAGKKFPWGIYLLLLNPTVKDCKKKKKYTKPELYKKAKFWQNIKPIISEQDNRGINVPVLGKKDARISPLFFSKTSIFLQI